MTAKLKTTIEKSFKDLVQDTAFQAEISKIQATDTDGLLINNSFIYRDGIQTNKSLFYPILRFDQNGQLLHNPSIAEHDRLIGNTKVIRPYPTSGPTPLSSAIASQLKDFGSLPFILIGRIKDNQNVETEIQHSKFKKLILNPRATKDLSISKDSLTMRTTRNPDSCWQVTKDYLIKEGESQDSIEKLQHAFFVAHDRVVREARALLLLPRRNSKTSGTLIDLLIDSLTSEKTEYDQAFQACAGNPSQNPRAFNELLRISYNFAEDALVFLKLIISLCDLKPILLWGTIHEHYALHNALKDLPLLRRKKKESFSEYISAIKNARNATFHRLIGIDKGLAVTLPTGALKDPELFFFSSHTNRNQDNRLTFADREIIDVFLELTRTPELELQPAFWQQNANIMEQTLNLLRATKSFLGVIRKES